MTSAPASGNEHGSPNSKLNSAISDFAASFIKRELQQLTRECDEALHRVYAQKIHSLLLEVDKERQSFDNAKKKMLQNLRKKLEALDVDDDTMDAVIADLQDIYPTYLNAIPDASVLSVDLPTLTMSSVSSSSDSQLSSLGDTVDIDIDQATSPAPIQHEDGQVPIPTGGDHHESTRKSRRISQTGNVSTDYKVQGEPASTDARMNGSRKRSRDQAFGSGAETGTPSKVKLHAGCTHRFD